MLITLNTLLGKILSVGFVGCVIQLGFRTFVLTLLEGKEGVSIILFVCCVEEFFLICETVRSYSAQYVKEYIGAAKPLFSVGECWDSCNYNGHGLDYNQGFITLLLSSSYTVLNVFTSGFDQSIQLCFYQCSKNRSRLSNGV